MGEVVDALTVGESMGAIRADGLVRYGATARLSIAGTEGNVTIGLSRLANRARWVGVVGDDQMGALVLRTLRAEDVDISSARVDPEALTGILVYEERMSGLVSADYHRRGSAATRLTPDHLAAAFVPQPRYLHVTGVTAALGGGPYRTVSSGICVARERGVTVCLDGKYRCRLWSAERASELLAGLVDSVDLVVASEDELPLLARGEGVQEMALWLLDQGVTEVVVKQGSAGATAYTEDGVVRCAARTVAVADTVGAGDGFVAGLLSGCWTDCPPCSGWSERMPW